MNKEHEQRIKAAGRDYLRKWLDGALKHGTVYYTQRQRGKTINGLRRAWVNLYTVHPNTGKLHRLWPSTDDHFSDVAGMPPESEMIDIIAKDWEFTLKKRAFAVYSSDSIQSILSHLARRCMFDAAAHNFLRFIIRDTLE